MEAAGRNPNFRDPMGYLDIGGKRHILYKGLNTIGRNKTATVIIRNENVSQQHAMITIIDEDRQFVSDFQSYNGTFLDKEKLLPLRLYKISDGTEIEFSNLVGIFKKQVPGDAGPTSDHYHDYNKDTQNVEESFYTAFTQAVEDAPTKLADGSVVIEPPDCFEDDYNFADVPSPVQHDSIINESKSNLLIHEMPTQLYCSDVTNDVVITASQIEIVADREMKTRDNNRKEAGTSKDTNVDIHNLPTQLMCDDTGDDVSKHDLPTQLMCVDVSDDIQNEMAVGSKKEHVDHSNKENIASSSNIHDMPTQCAFNNKFKLENNSTNMNNSKPSVNIVQMPPALETTSNKDKTPNSSPDDSFEEIHNRKSSANVTTDIIQETILDDSGLDITSSYIREQVSGKTPERAISPGESDSQSNIHVSQLYRRTLRPIADEPEDVCTPDSEVIMDKSKKKNVQPLRESSSENTDIEMDNEAKGQVSADVSGSDTDIEDLKIDERRKVPKNKSHGKKALEKPASSDSETDVEELEAESTRTRLQNRKSKKLSIIDKSSGSDTDIDTNAATYKPLKSFVSDKYTKMTDLLQKHSDSSDTDIDNIESTISNKTLDEKKVTATTSKSSNSSNEKIEENNSNNLNDSDVIPPTQDSEEDDDDFNFAPKDHSTVIHKSSVNYSPESVDIYQKLMELRNKTVLPQQCSEESFKLGLSVEEEGDDDDRTPDISDTDEPIDTKKTNKTIEQQEHDNSKDDLDNIFEMQTQKLSETVVSNDDDIFRKPIARDLTDKNKVDVIKQNCDDVMENDSDDMDALFLQPTQALTGEAEQLPQLQRISSDSEVLKINDDDDIFLQATQKVGRTTQSLESKLEPVSAPEDIFMQPTQALPLHNKSIDVKEGGTEDIFIQATQKIAVADVIPDTTKCSEDIFNQPTQAIIVKDSKLPAKDQDIFSKPTQVLTVKDNKIPAKDQDIFNEPTQVVTMKDGEISTEDQDVFNEPTQVITVKNSEISTKDQEIEINKMESISQKSKLSLSLGHKSPEPQAKPHEIESQLEVMFATQTLQIPSETNSRPLNPLVNVLEGKRDTDSEQNSEELPAAQSPSDDEAANLKEYRAMATLPLDDVDDFQPQKEKASDKKMKTPLKKQVKSKSQKSDENVAADRGTRSTRQQKHAPEAAVKGNRLEEVKQENAESVGVRKSGRSSKTPAKFRDAAESQEPPASANKRLRQNQTEIKLDHKHENVEEENVESEVNEPNVQVRGRRKANTKHKDENDSNQDESILKTSKAKKEVPKTRLRGQLHSEKIASPTEQRNLSSEKKNLSKTSPSIQTSNKKEHTISDVLVDNVTTPRRTRQVKSHENDDKNALESESAGNKSTKSKSKAKKSNLKGIQEETEMLNDPGSPASCTSLDVPARTTSRKIKKETNPDPEQGTVTPKKKAKSAEKETANTAPRTTSSRRVKRELSMESDKNTSSKQTKKRKMLESSSESEEINISTSSTSKKQLNVTAGSPDRTRRKQKPKVVFTMLDSPELESIIRSLGGSIVDSVEACTVLVTGALKRSQKLLSAVGQGKPICSPNWIKESKKANSFCDPWDFILQDKEAEKKWKFSLKESLKRSLNKKLFENFVVQIVATNAVDVLKAAVESCGGKCLSKASAKNTETKFIVVAAPDNKSKYSKFLKQKPPVTVVAPEAIFDGVLRQELHLDDHALSL